MLSCFARRPPILRLDPRLRRHFQGIKLGIDGSKAIVPGCNNPETKRHLLSALQAYGSNPDSRVRFQDLRVLEHRPDVLPAILVRDTCIILSLADLRAVVQRDNVTVYHEQPKVLDGIISQVELRLAEAAAKKQNENNPNPTENHEGDFEIVVVDQLLSHAMATQKRQMRMIANLIDFALEDISRSATTVSLQALLPLNRALRRYEHELREQHSAVNELLASDEDMANMQLTRRPTDFSQHDEIEIMLEGYRQRVREITGECERLLLSIEDFQNTLDTNLDIYRNQIIWLSFHVNTLTLGVSVSAVGAGLFGMNFQFPPFEQPGLFMPYTAGIAVAGIATWLCFLVIFMRRQRPKKNFHAADISQLLGEVNHVESATQAIKATNLPLDHETVRQHLASTMTTPITERHIKLVLAALK